MQNFKERWQKLSDNTKKIITAITAGTLVIAVACVLAFNLLGGNGDYSTLFTDLSQEDAQQVVSLLQDQGIDYKYDNTGGSIRVPEATVDQTRAQLLSQGYPKSGFTYDMYLDNSGIMTTESDKKQFSLYALQDRLGAQISLFEGVQDAKVTIASGDGRTYALADDGGQSASASVVVTMKRGSSLTSDKASAIKNLIARSVKGMNFTNVAVFDAATMLEVGTEGNGEDDPFGTTKDMTSLTTLIESNIATNVRRVLEQIYGQGNVAVSVKGTLNMEKLIQENTQYTTPDKIDEQDKTGLLQHEEVANENSGAAAQNPGGVVGADANADVPRYENNADGQVTEDTYANSSATRDWLYNSLKEQRQVDPGVLEDTTVGVVINTNDMQSVSQQDLIRLVANSSGIPVDVANEKITVVRAAASNQAEQVVNPDPSQNQGGILTGNMLPLVIAGAAAVVLLLLLLLLLLLRSRAKRRNQLELIAGGELDENGLPIPPMPDSESDEFPGDGGQQSAAASDVFQLEEEEDARNEEIINLRMQRNLRLKQNIGDFVDQNPQIVAKLVQSWLRGEEETDGRRKSGKH